MPKKAISKTTSKDKITGLIQELESARGSRVLIYFTGEKAPQQQFATQVASDVIPLFKNILEDLGQEIKKISLVLNTSGGHLETPWPLVNLIREYCEEFEVIVLEKALSAGTMICLGADKIIMQPYSQLSPIDPAADISDGKNGLKRLEIEDVVGFLDFVKEKVGVNEQSSLAEVVKELTKEINPTMLGSVNRTHSLIRRLSNSLLRLHKKKLPDRQIKEIVENLTQKLYSHRHLINRKEAKESVGFENIIEDSDAKVKKIADSILLELTESMQLDKEFNPLEMLEKINEKKVDIIRAVVYGSKVQYNFQSQYHIIKTPDPAGNQQILVNNISNKWIKK